MIAIAKASLFGKRVSNFVGDVDDELNNTFTELLDDYTVSQSNKKIVNGVIVDIEQKGRSSRVFFDIGNKTEGSIPLRTLESIDNQDYGDEQDDTNKKEKMQVGDVMRLYVEESDPYHGGYAVLNRERVILENRWEELQKKFADSDIVDGCVVSKVRCGFVVDLYGGITAFLPGSQLDLQPINDISPLLGRRQPFIILKMDEKQGNIVVSRRAVLENNFNEQREQVINNIEEGQIVEGVVKNITKYGAFIDLGGVDGLAHLTDLSWRKITTPLDVLSLRQKVRMKVIKVTRDGKKIRISLGKKQLEESPWDRAHDNYPVGSQHKAIVTSIADYGIFAELTGESGVEGLVYQNDISWSRKVNSNPSHHYHKGQEIEVKILDIDVEKLRIGLSIKDCQGNPWVSFANHYKAGQVIKGVVKHIVDFGLFVGLPGEGWDIEGLIHYQDMSWNKDACLSMKKKFNKGDEIEVKILTINPTKEKISLGIKQIEHDPMEVALQSMKLGQLLEGVVVNIIQDDVFVELSKGVEICINKNDVDDRAKKDIFSSLNLYSKVVLEIIEVAPEYRLIKTSIVRKI